VKRHDKSIRGLAGEEPAVDGDQAVDRSRSFLGACAQREGGGGKQATPVLSVCRAVFAYHPPVQQSGRKRGLDVMEFRMKPREPERLGQEWRVHRANDVWKARRNTRVIWSSMAALAVHGVVIVASPSWQVPPPPLDAELESDEMAWIALLAPPASGTGASPGATPVARMADSVATASDLGEGADGTELSAEEYAAAIRQRLLRHGGPVPTLAEPDLEPEPVEPVVSEDPQGLGEEGQESTAIGGSASTADLSLLPEGTAMDLSRLASLRPDIVLAGSAAWVLVLNPRAVLRYMRESFSRQRLGPDVTGSVSVVLFIDEQGSVEMAEIGQSSGIPAIDDIFLKLFTEVIAFRPARDRGVPVPRSAVFSVPFPW
jgi:hypothetical protein